MTARGLPQVTLCAGKLSHTALHKFTLDGLRQVMTIKSQAVLWYQYKDGQYLGTVNFWSNLAHYACRGLVLIFSHA